jgi:hypothetical protein
MASDPRRRSSAGSAAPVLLAGDDAMDEDDEDLVDEPLQDSSSAPSTVAYPSSSHHHPGSTYSSSDFHDSSTLDGNNAASSTGGGYPQQQQPHMDLISTIITPSPFAHHTTGPTSSRFRNALQRISANPQSDVEAWQALLTEVSTCWKSLQMTKNIHALDAETQLQLDWIESCYGALLKYFPYSSSHYVAIGDILFVQSAKLGEEGGPKNDYGGLLVNTQRAQQAQIKLETLLRETLGVDLEGNVPRQQDDEDASLFSGITSVDVGVPDHHPDQFQQQQKNRSQRTRHRILSVLLGGMCTSSVELWLLYIKTRIRQARRRFGNDAKAVLEDSKQAYDLACEHGGFTCFDNHVLWREYLTFAKSQAPTTPQNEQDRNTSLLIMTPQQHMLWMRSIYQKLVCHPMTGLDQLWQEYEAFERQQSEALAAALVAEWAPKYQHARNVYLERNRVFSVQDLQWKTRLAVPPVSKSSVDMVDGGGSALGSGSGNDTTSKILTDDGDGNDLQEYQAKLKDEFEYLILWKKRCAYERTNPERLTNPQDLTRRVRQAYKEMICVLTLYPEVWHMWSMWEDTLGTGADASSADRVDSRAVAVLKLSQTYIPDSTLLAHAHAQLVELNATTHASAAATNGRSTLSGGPKPSDALKVLESYLDRAPTSLGFCLYQRLVRRYKGREAARAVFAKARRVLAQASQGGDLGIASSSTAALGAEASGSGGGGDGTSLTTATQQESRGVGEDSKMALSAQEKGRRWMVTNRLDPSIGVGNDGMKKDSAGLTSRVQGGQYSDSSSNNMIVPPGPITWHLYACHATIEHRLNKAPEIAARVYELGLRKNAGFLTKPPYVLRYAHLLLELQDTVNLRALLTRALAACGDSKSSPTTQIGALWDMTLLCEDLWSIADPRNIDAAMAVERKRRAALLGPDIEDVSTGSRVGLGDSGATVGVQKSTLAEQLVRSDGYNSSSLIVNGMGRTVDFLDVTGLWGDGVGIKRYLNMSQADDADETIPGGRSDRSFQRRLLYARRVAVGDSIDLMPGMETGSKLLSARERLQQQGGGVQGLQNTPIQMAIQQSPEWLRTMLLLLPASKLRSSIIPKSPPHLVEMALSSLRLCKLPAERPSDDGGNGLLSGNKRSLEPTKQNGNGGGDSSDEDTGPSGSGGYGTQFRARQRARISSHANGI